MEESSPAVASVRLSGEKAIARKGLSDSPATLFAASSSGYRGGTRGCNRAQRPFGLARNPFCSLEFLLGILLQLLGLCHRFLVFGHGLRGFVGCFARQLQLGFR